MAIKYNKETLFIFFFIIKKHLITKKPLIHVGPPAHGLYLRAPLTFELLDCSVGKSIPDFPFA